MLDELIIMTLQEESLVYYGCEIKLYINMSQFVFGHAFVHEKYIVWVNTQENRSMSNIVAHLFFFRFVLVFQNGHFCPTFEFSVFTYLFLERCFKC